MIELVDVKMENFRSFAEGTFEPAPLGSGMTAIVGENGAGKSTIITAIVWALFGVTPDGIHVRALRRQGSSEPVVATITFRHDGQTIQVSRALRGKNDTTIAGVIVDGVEQTNISSRAATDWVTKHVGLDAEAFLTAYVIRQKELDSLVKARPADRRKTIERLAGVERMAKTVEVARANARELQRAVSNIPAPECDIEEAAEYVTKAETLVNAEKAHVNKARAALTAAQRYTTEQQRLWDISSRLQRSAEKLDYELDAIRRDLEDAERDLHNLMEKKPLADNLAHAQAASVEASEMLSTSQAKIDQVSAAITRATDLQSRSADAETYATDAQNAVDNIREELGVISETLATMGDPSLAIRTTKGDLDALRERHGATKGESVRLNRAIAALKAHNDPECPTCASPLTDASTLIDTLANTLELSDERVVSLEGEILSASTDVDRLINEKASRDKLISRQTHLHNEVTERGSQIKELAEKAAQLAETADDAAEKAHDMRTIANEAKMTIPQLQAAESRARKLLHTSEEAFSLLENLPSTTERRNTTRAAHEAKTSEHRRVLTAAQEATTRISDDEIKAARENVAILERELGITETTRTIAERDLDAANERKVRVERATLARTELFNELEEATATASALDEFRRDRLSRLAPELSEIASEFVCQITGGQYTAVDLDEDFTPVLTEANGEQRPIAWLSGGEESAVALALRIAIGEVLSGRSGGLLILDEVLTAQDSTRRSAAMAAIRDLPRQVIVINHVAEATDMVDHVIAVEKHSDISFFIPETADTFPVPAAEDLR